MSTPASLPEKVQSLTRVFEKFGDPAAAALIQQALQDTPPDVQQQVGIAEWLTQIAHVEGNVNIYQGFSQDAESLLQEISHKLDRLSPQQTPLLDRPPYPGLRALGPDDAPIFFGRETETDALVAHLSNPNCRFLAVIGASGSGKSSLVGAGLLPRLQKNAIPGSRDWKIVHFRPDQLGSGNPFAALVNALPGAEPGLADRLSKDPAALDALIPGAEILLFVDQFEETFTLTEPEYRRPFIDLISNAAYSDRARVVLTLRADFYARCLDWPQLAALLRTGSYPLARPGLGAMYQMITRPANLAELTFADGLAERFLEDTGTEPGSLALMAYALNELYLACKRDGRFTHAAYEALGGVQGAISTRAETVYTGLDKDAQGALPDVFRELVEVNEQGEPTRRYAPLNTVTRTEAAAKLVKELTKPEVWLLVTSRDSSDEPQVEVAHEALLRSWPRLATWIESTRDDLWLLRQVKQAAAEWDRNERQAAYLWPDERLKPVYAMRGRLKPDLTETEREFIRPEIDRLLEEIDDPATDHSRRSTIGERLCAIDDMRPGVGLRLDGLPDIVWCPVPGGEVTLEDNKGIFTVEPLYIAKYPITYIQFQAFLDDPNGFDMDEWWKELATKFRKQVLREQRFKFANYPRENVSWYQSMAFCHWLTAKLTPHLIPMAGGQMGVIRLPTEWEWQMAATGGITERAFPWGPQWRRFRANTNESGLGRLIAVGMYPHAASPVGALDMSGNVEEWCLNEYRNPGKLRLSETKERALRGGSWNKDLLNARSARRFGQSPRVRHNDRGLRVVWTVVPTVDE